MKRILYSLSLVLLAIFAFNACDNGNADTEVFDSPPSIKIVSPGNFALEGSLNLTVEFKDGADESLSRSPLASASFSIFEDDSSTVVGQGNFSVSGISTVVNQAFTGTLTPGNYFFNVSATDSKGNTTRVYKKFQLIQNFESVGIIGSATANGWDSDINMTQDAANPALWVLNSITLTDGEAKFRANDAWTVNWGANAFPTGTGIQNGPNIPVEAGTYKVTLNITTGEYKFE